MAYLFQTDGHARMQATSIEQQITSLGFPAPRITPDQVDALVAKLSFHTYVIPGTTTTIAAAIDPTGFVLGIGQAASISVANFDEVIGRNRAVGRAEAQAREELWKLEGYRLRRNLAEAAKSGLIGTIEEYSKPGEALSPDFAVELAEGICAAEAAAGVAKLVRGAAADGVAEVAREAVAQSCDGLPRATGLRRQCSCPSGPCAPLVSIRTGTL